NLEKKKITLTLHGCSGAGSLRCGESRMWTYSLQEKRYVNAVCRLYLHTLFDRKYILNQIIQDYDEGWQKKSSKDPKDPKDPKGSKDIGKCECEELEKWISKDQKVTLTDAF